MRKALEGFVVDDRRGEERATLEPAGEIVERVDGCEHLYKMINGKKTLIRQGGHAVEVLIHHFETCETCGQTHMLVGDETLACPRMGWSWTMGYGIGYGSRGRDDARRQLSPVAENQRHHNLDHLGRLIGYTGG